MIKNGFFRTTKLSTAKKCFDSSPPLLPKPIWYNREAKKSIFGQILAILAIFRCKNKDFRCFCSNAAKNAQNVTNSGKNDKIMH